MCIPLRFFSWEINVSRSASCVSLSILKNKCTLFAQWSTATSELVSIYILKLLYYTYLETVRGSGRVVGGIGEWKEGLKEWGSGRKGGREVRRGGRAVEWRGSGRREGRAVEGMGEW